MHGCVCQTIAQSAHRCTNAYCRNATFCEATLLRTKKRDQFYWISISANLSQKECVASSRLSSAFHASMRILLITGSHFPSTNPRVWPFCSTPETSHLQSPWKRNFLSRLVKTLGCEEINRPTVKSMESFSASEPSELWTFRFFCPRHWRLGLAAKRLGWTEQKTESVQSWSRGRWSDCLEVDGFVCKDKNSCGDR